MISSEGWIKLHRSLLSWEWYDDINAFRLFVHCLLKANHKEKNWRGNNIEVGTFISSYQKLSEETGLTVKQVRLSIDKLKRTNEMATKGTAQYTIFQIVKYSEYQQEDKLKGKRGASEGQTEGKRGATTNNDKNDKNDKNERIKEDREKDFRLAASQLSNNQNLVNEFCDYWTESKPNGKKMKFEMEKTFDLERRFKKWESNSKKWGGDQKPAEINKLNNKDLKYEDTL